MFSLGSQLQEQQGHRVWQVMSFAAPKVEGSKGEGSGPIVPSLNLKEVSRMMKTRAKNWASTPNESLRATA